MSLALDHPDLAPRTARVAVFVNPNANARKTRRYIARLQEVFSNSGISPKFIVPANIQELESNAKSTIDGGAQLLLAIGGDGTVQNLVNAIYGSSAVLGILPAGGGNDFAGALGILTDPWETIRALRDGVVRRIDLLRVRTADGRERLYCGGGGIGLDANAAAYASGKFRNVTGKMRYLLSALAALRSYSPKNVRVEFPDAPDDLVEKKVMVAAALNTPSYGAGLRMAAEARIDDGKLDVVLIDELSSFEILQVLANWLATNTLKSPRVLRRTATRVRFTSDPPCAFHADGEIFGLTPVEISVVPKAIRVLVPYCGRPVNPSPSTVFGLEL